MAVRWISYQFLTLPISSSLLRHSYRIRFRREANQADNKAATIAVDSLINFEAVKVWPLSTYNFFSYTYLSIDIQ